MSYYNDKPTHDPCKMEYEEDYREPIRVPDSMVPDYSHIPERSKIKFDPTKLFYDDDDEDDYSRRR